MTTLISIDGMTCEHCAGHVKEALSKLDGVSSVQVDLAGNTATVEHGGVEAARFTEALEDSGFDVLSIT